MCMSYYDGTKILSTLDINGDTPEIYMITSNRTAGKTTFFSRMLVKRFLRSKRKFCLVQRFDGELKGCSSAFFKDIKSLFFKRHEMDEKHYKDLGYCELFLDGNPCGYGVAINTADKIKKISHFFNDVDAMFMDEFQSETNHYCPGEIKKFISIHTSIARGQGKQIRYVPVYMCANPVTLLNPYYNALGVSGRLHKNTKILRGEGWVLEQGFNESASKAQKESAFNRAFKGEKYVEYAGEAVYLNDSTAFVTRPKGKNRYIFTLKYASKFFGVYEYPHDGVIFCSKKFDPQYPKTLVVTTDDHNINYLMLQRNELLILQLRSLFEKGCFRFSDLECKEVILKMLSYY